MRERRERERERMKVKEMIAILFHVTGTSKEGRTQSCDTNNYMQCAPYDILRATIMDKAIRNALGQSHMIWLIKIVAH